MENLENLKNNKSKFSFSAKNKKEVDPKETENFNIEELKQYYTQFMNNYNNIKEEIANFSQTKNLEINKDNLKKILDTIVEKLKVLKDDYLNNVSFLTGHDKLKYMNCLEELSSLLEEQKDSLNPKKKFAFSVKPKISVKNELNQLNNLSESLNTNIDNKFVEGNRNLFETSSDYIIKDKSDAVVYISEEEIADKNNLIVENLSNCEIKILHSFKALYIKNVSNSKFFIGSIGGGSHITNVKDSYIYLATHQLRIHETFSTHFFIISSSNPIIENSSKLVFSPLNIEYEKQNYNLTKSKIEQNKNKWNSVLDFNWHKKDKSPNFEYEESPLIFKIAN